MESELSYLTEEGKDVRGLEAVPLVVSHGQRASCRFLSFKASVTLNP